MVEGGEVWLIDFVESVGFNKSILYGLLNIFVVMGYVIWCGICYGLGLRICEIV